MLPPVVPSMMRERKRRGSELAKARTTKPRAEPS